jgi:hypothetical protein
MVGLAATTTIAMTTTMTTLRQQQQQKQHRQWGALGSMQERMRQLHSAKAGQQHKPNAVDANIEVSVLQRLALGHHSDDGRGNVVMLAGRRHNKSW